MSKSLSEDSVSVGRPYGEIRETNRNVSEIGRPVAPTMSYGNEVETGDADEPDEPRDSADEEMLVEGDALASNSEIRGISINPLSSGYMVKVGCQSVAVESTETLVKMLDKYLNDPADFERKWYSKNVRNRLANIL